MLGYLAKNIYSIPINSRRIISIDNDKEEIKFKIKKGDNRSEEGSITLSYVEFIRRLATHIQPSRFQKIRYYGFLGCAVKAESLSKIFEQKDEIYIDHSHVIQTCTAFEFIQLYTDWKPNVCSECRGAMLPYEEYVKRNSKPPPPAGDK